MLFDNKTLKILDEFSSDYNRKIYGRDIAKRNKMNQKTVSNILNKLEKENILKFSYEGKNKYYYLNKFNLNLKEIIKIIEIDRKIRFIEKNKKLKELFDKIEQRTTGILAVFGSYAKGINTEKSDLDVFIMGKISNIDDLEELYSIKINIIKSDKSKFNKEEPIIIEIIKNHIILKGLEEFIELIWQP
jgi:predicted nucleotidyltransferase